MKEIISLRHALHRNAELSGSEKRTAALIAAFLKKQKPDALIEHIGGYGLAAVYKGKTPGKTVLVRADMDALPIKDSIARPYVSKNPGAAHKCGHDGHSAALCALAALLHANPPRRGTAVLLFQPEEETVSGARAVLADKKFAVLKPDIAFALHNCPGISKGTLLIKCGVICRATAGLIILLKGRTSHASEPEKGNNPALALAEIVRAAQKLPRGVKGAKLTVIGIKLGGRAFGTSPGDGELCLTVRAETDAELKKLIKKCAASARKTATRYKLKVSVSLTDECPETANGEHAAALARQAARTLGMKSMEPRGSFPTGEDFGYFTKKFGGALVWIGAGTQHAPLHSAQYDYPDGLLRRSAAYLRALIDCAIL